jgi:hypothetical protein
VKYGTDVYDQWSVDELLILAKASPLGAFEGQHHVVNAITPKEQI